MTTTQASALCKAINQLERACLSPDSTKTTVAQIRENGVDETKHYFRWLERQAPGTAMGLPDFETFFK